LNLGVVTATALASVSWGVLALGAVYPWAYWPVLWGAFITGLMGLHRGPGVLPTLRQPLLLSALALCFAVMLQLIPLSPSVLQTISPSTHAFVQAYMTLPDEVVTTATNGTVSVRPAGAVQPLSLRPRATVTSLVFVLAFGLAIAGAATGLGAKDARHLASGLLVLGTIVAFIAILQRAMPDEQIYWLWERRYRNAAWGPFFNRNHFAGWMVMTISVGLGYFMAVCSRAMRGIEGWRNRVLWLSSSEASGIVIAGIALAVMGFSLALTASRSGTICFIASMLVVCVSAMRKRSHTAMPRQRRSLMVTYVACLAFFTVVWTAMPVIASRFSATGSPFSVGGRIEHWNDALQVARRFPVTGTGLNTFTFVTPFFKTSGAANSDEAHNDYLQLAAEGGLLVGIPAIVLAVVFIREVRRRFDAGKHGLTSYWIRAGAVAGLVAMALQETVEFSLQLPGNAVMFTALCALAVHKPEGE
jgi:O-antigen ligase